ncbi:Polyisoprenoid-binding protein YceI [Geodermatophilus telluris]|uniref:Polyisoprenoid-binding protein YceI n=1 Tax=Geodermatophilus telluris TaxID=1190417 RepID=A0A1G6LCV4_9ACTN|nr:YceI family protein [Geodermatophilus telluris]SDC40466.1 Polyisoprenoid-binding protein YceI [Geodermatophilus telluris]
MARRRHVWWVVGGVAALVVLGLGLGPLVYAASQEDAAAAPTVQAQPSGVELAPDTDGTWTVGPGSSAGYRVDEVLNGADVTVAGTTDRVTGSVVVEGGDLATAEVVVDVASTRTDVGQRDAYFRDDVMEVGTWPTGTFAVQGPVDLPELTGTPVTVPVAGQLTLRDTTRPVRADLSVVRTAEGVEVSGAVPVVFGDFGITPPDLGFVRVEDTGQVEFLLRLAQ